MVHTQLVTEFFGITGNPKEPRKRLSVKQLASTASALQQWVQGGGALQQGDMGIQKKVVYL